MAADTVSNDKEDSTLTGGIAIVSVVDIAVLVGLVLVVVAIILRCRRKNSDESARLREVTVKAK